MTQAKRKAKSIRRFKIEMGAKRGGGILKRKRKRKNLHPRRKKGGDFESFVTSRK